MPERPHGSGFITRLRARLRAFARAEGGVSAIEFAMLLPVMLTMYIGAVELSHGLTIDRRVTSVASAVADLTAQVEEVDDDTVQDIFEASSSIMTPYPVNPLSIVLTSVVADEDNKTTVAWSEARNDTAREEGSDVTLPEGLTQPFSSVIVAEVSYTYNPPAGEYVTGSVTLNDTFYLRPRRSLRVEKTD